MPSYKFIDHNVLPSEGEESEKVEVSREALSIFRHETIVGIMVAYHAYLTAEDKTTREDAKENCLEIMSAMVEDGRCSAPDIVEFRNAIDNEHSPFTLLELSSKQCSEATAVRLGAIVNLAQSERVAELNETERAAIEAFQTTGEEFRQKAGELYTMFLPHFQDIVSPILKSYRGFDRTFVEAFSE